MDETAIQSSPNPPAPVETGIQSTPDAVPKLDKTDSLPEPSPTVVKSKKRGPVYKAFSALASLRLTVILFALGIFLIFAGTVAQVDAGIWTVVSKYFRTFKLIWIPFYIFFPRTVTGEPAIPGSFPFPGGYLIGSVLLANLLAAHALHLRVRLKRPADFSFPFAWGTSTVLPNLLAAGRAYGFQTLLKQSGIFVIHAGIIVMLLGELIAGELQTEGHMSIDEGRSSNFIEHNRYGEVAVINTSDPVNDDVVVIPDGLLRKGGAIHDDQLPFDVEIVRYMINSQLANPKDRDGKAEKNPATVGAGLERVAVPLSEFSGVSQASSVETPSAYVTFKNKSDGKSLGTFLLSIWLSPQPLTVDGKTYQVVLRFKRTYFPYSLYLNEFRFDRYVGTSKPKNYSSDIRLIDPQTGEDRRVTIRMNEPLRYDGNTFFQADFDKETEKTTILQVVRNPGDWLPYISCIMVSCGMIIHFSLHLFNFILTGVLRTRAA
jgi:hypothetical protein